MINVSEVLKNIMDEYSLNQAQLSRALVCDYSTISKYISGTRKPDIETFENILNKFGYELKVESIDKIESKMPKDFYMPKTYKQLLDLSVEDLTEYIYVIQDIEVLASILGINEEIVEYIDFKKQKEIIYKKLSEMSSILEVYFILNKKFYGVEAEMAHFIKHAKYHLENLSNIPKNMINDIEYISFNIGHYNEGQLDEYYTLYNLKALDKYKNELDISSDDIDGNYVPLDDSLDNKVGEYYYTYCDYTEHELQFNY